MERTVRTQQNLLKSDGIEVIDSSTTYETDSSKPQLQSLGSIEEQSPCTASHRTRNKVKLLIRSHAVREETSPPPDPQPDSLKHEKKNKGVPPLSRGNSREQFDGNSHPDLHHFFKDTLNRSEKDRSLLFRIENELINLANDSKRTMHKFPQMSSYQRMLVHRVAAYFNMEHNVDTTGSSVIVNTTKSTRIPESRFRDLVQEDMLLTEEPKRSILKRDSSSFDETGTYKFDGDIDVIDDLHWENEEVFKNNDVPTSNPRNQRLLKVESYESGDALRANSLRPSVVKSHSFNGYEPQQQLQISAQSERILTKQDSGASMSSSRISPTSSGYKSQRSDATLSTTPSPTATPNLQTQSGHPYTNPDGTVYHYDPNNPPQVVTETPSRDSPQVTGSQQITQSPAKHVFRGLPHHQTYPLQWASSLSGQPISIHGCEAVIPKMESSYEAQYIPVPQQYTQQMEPQQIQFHPVYPPPPPPHHYPPQRIQESLNGGELSQYMVGLSVDGTRQAPPPPPPPSETRPVMYWQPHNVQSQTGGGTVYYAAPGGGPRYPPQVAPQQYIPPPPPPQPHPPPDHSGNCYSGTYPSSECMPYAPSTVHMYYTPPYSSSQNSTSQSSSAQPNGTYYGNMANCGAPILTVQYPQPCPHPASPHPPQGVCSQFAVYNSCYPTHYSQPTATLPVPAQLFRKPSLQVGVRCNSPLRPQYPPSPTVKDRSPDHDKMQPLPVYGFRVLPGDMRILGNTGRMPFTLQAPPKNPHARKHRSKLGGRPQEVYHPASKA